MLCVVFVGCVRAACTVGVCRLLCATIGLPRHRTIGELGYSLGRSMAQKHWRYCYPFELMTCKKDSNISYELCVSKLCVMKDTL